jgi:hypothetical protein
MYTTTTDMLPFLDGIRRRLAPGDDADRQEKQ